MRCLVVYDIPDDAARAKVADACLDYGLERIQLSAFMGDISANHQAELFLKIRRQLSGRAANVQLFPICDRDARQRRVLATTAPAAPLAGAADGPRTGKQTTALRPEPAARGDGRLMRPPARPAGRRRKRAQPQPRDNAFAWREA